MYSETFVQKFDSNIERIDKKLDKENKVDEKTVINKVKEVKNCLINLNKIKLSALKDKLPPDKYKKVEKEFLALKASFKTDIETTNHLLEKITALRFDAYKKLSTEYWRGFMVLIKYLLMIN